MHIRVVGIYGIIPCLQYSLRLILTAVAGVIAMYQEQSYNNMRESK